MKKLLYLLLLTPVIYLASCSKPNLAPEENDLNIHEIIVGKTWKLLDTDKGWFRLNNDNTYSTKDYLCDTLSHDGTWELEENILIFTYTISHFEYVERHTIIEFNDSIVKIQSDTSATLDINIIFEIAPDLITGCADTLASNYNPLLDCIDNSICIYDNIEEVLFNSVFYQEDGLVKLSFLEDYTFVKYTCNPKNDFIGSWALDLNHASKKLIIKDQQDRLLQEITILSVDPYLGLQYHHADTLIIDYGIWYNSPLNPSVDWLGFEFKYHNTYCEFRTDWSADPCANNPVLSWEDTTYIEDFFNQNFTKMQVCELNNNIFIDNISQEIISFSDLDEGIGIESWDYEIAFDGYSLIVILDQQGQTTQKLYRYFTKL